MTIKRLSKKQELKDSDDEERSIEKVTEEFIGAGGKTTNELIKEDCVDDHREPRVDAQHA